MPKISRSFLGNTQFCERSTNGAEEVLTDIPENVEFCFTTSIGLSTNIVTKILRTFTRSAEYLSMLAKYRPPKVQCLDFRLPLP